MAKDLLSCVDIQATISRNSEAAAVSQQLKPNIPTLEEVQQAFSLDTEDTGDPTIDELEAIRFAYDYICRNVGH